MLPAVGDVYMPAGQVRKLGVQPDGVDGVVEARLRRDDALVFENHGHLDERHDGGAGLGVPDVGLDGAEDELVVGGARATNHVGDGLDLAHVAGHGAGAVGLDVADVLGGGVGHAHGLVEDALLARLVRVGDGRGVGRVVARPAVDHAQDPVAVQLGVLEPLQHHGPDRLAAAVPVHVVAKGLAAARRRQEPALGQPGHGVRRAREHRPAHHRRVAVAPHERRARQRDGHGAGSARRVHREGRALAMDGT